MGVDGLTEPNIRLITFNMLARVYIVKCQMHSTVSIHIEVFVLDIGSVMTPYYSEETVYSRNDLEMDNEDGISVIFYLQKIFPGFIQ